MTRAVIDIDDESLTAAAEVLGTTTKVATVNRALSEVAARPARLAFLNHLDEAVGDLGDSELTKDAWLDGPEPG